MKVRRRFADLQHHQFKKRHSVALKVDEKVHAVPAPSGLSDVKDLMKASLWNIRQNDAKKELAQECKYLVQHMDRGWGFICFR